MAERAPNEGGEAGEASRQESFLDQFLRRLDQTDQEAAPSTSSSDYVASNPWSSFISPAAPPPGSPGLNPDLTSSYRYSANPLAEFPWLLEEFDQQQSSRVVVVAAPGGDVHDSAHPRYSSLNTTQEPLGPPSTTSPPVKEEPGGSSTTRRRLESGTTTTTTTIQPAIISSDIMSEPVPRFGTEPPGSTKPMSSRPPPTSPLLSDATGGAGAGSVTTSAGTSNASLSSESTSNAGDDDDDDEGEVKKATVHSTEGGASSGKRKKPEAGDRTPESKIKSDQPKNKPRKRGGAKRLREPRYAIKTRTDVDVLDDGFKWRKYGQKAVKNSPHPRNYYRCTTPLCPVRKRVERSNEDAGLVITTYEGTHTHQTPGFHHRPSVPGGYFGDRALGMGGGLFQSPLGPGGSTLLPLPPGFDLASLQQAAALRNIRGLQPNHQNLLPGSSRGQQLGSGTTSLFRAQQFLDLQADGGGATTSPFVKQEPFQFTAGAQDFMSRNLSMTMSDQRLGISNSPLNIITGLSNFPRLQPPPPAAGGNISGNSTTSTHELQPSSQIDESLETIVSSSSGQHPSFHEGAESQPRRSSQIIRGGHQQSSSVQHQQRQLSSSTENLHGLESESGAREGLLQDMVRHGGPKVSKS